MLQDIGNSLSKGLTHEVSSEIVVNQPDDCHLTRDVPYAGVQIEALFGLLVDIVFRDTLVVDSDFTDAWSDYESTFAPLLHSGLVRGLPFKVNDNELNDSRQFVLDRLCVTSTLREEQMRNEESWSVHKGTVNSYMSAVIWGTAGMLGRSHIFEAPYSGHPLRKRLIEQTILAPPSRDMVGETVQWMNEERFRLFETKASHGSQRTAMLIVPPVIIEVIEEANDITQLISIAYQLRDKYAKMREWLKSVQLAMDNEDPKGIAKYKKTLSAVSKDLNRATGNTESGKISLNIGFGLPSVSIPLGTIDGITKRFGMRAMLNNQIFTAQGEKSLSKLLRMFNEEKTSIGLTVTEYLRLSRRE